MHMHVRVHVPLKLCFWVFCNYPPALNLQHTVSVDDFLQRSQPLSEPHGHANQKEVWQALATPNVGLLVHEPESTSVVQLIQRETFRVSVWGTDQGTEPGSIHLKAPGGSP